MNRWTASIKFKPEGSERKLTLEAETCYFIPTLYTSHCLFRLIRGQTSDFCAGEMRLNANSDSVLPGSLKWRQQIGHAFRDRGLISNMTILDNVELPLRYHGIPDGKKIAMEKLRELEVCETDWGRRPFAASLATRKKTLLARSIALSPSMLLLEQPDGFLPWEELPSLLRWIRHQVSRGATILLSTETMPFGLAAADLVLQSDLSIVHRDGFPVSEYSRNQFLAFSHHQEQTP